MSPNSRTLQMLLLAALDLRSRPGQGSIVELDHVPE
jgi:hypothetical protein